MTKTERVSLRLTVETVQQAEELGKRWTHFPGCPISLAVVMAECVRRAHESEPKTKEKRR